MTDEIPRLDRLPHHPENKLGPARTAMIFRVDDYRHCVMVHRGGGDEQILWVGALAIHRMFDIPSWIRENTAYKAALDRNGGIVHVELVGVFDRAADAKAFASHVRQAYPPLSASGGLLGRLRVRCLDTGEIFATAGAAARAHGISAPAMSNHLNGRSGYTTVHGKRFERIAWSKPQSEPDAPQDAAWTPPIAPAPIGVDPDEEAAYRATFLNNREH